MLSSFSELIAPISVAEFFQTYHGKKPLHIPGTPEKVAANWAALSALVSQAGIWSSNSLELALQGKKIEAAEYCAPGQDRDNRHMLLADLAKVKAHLQRGASLVLNDVTSLTPEIANLANLLANGLGARVQINAYASAQAWQGFSSHFDTHDVWALHCEGEKTWNIYECHIPNPIAHPKFRTLGADYHKANRGQLTATITLKPGDLLYLPRGWYHDALATSAATLHLACGTTETIGLDALSQLFELAIDDPQLRADLPLPGTAAGHSEELLAKALLPLADKVAALIKSPAFRQRLIALNQAQRTPLGAITLPLVVRPPTYAPLSDVKIFQGPDGRWLLGSATKAAPVPPGLDEPVRWLLAQRQFTESELISAFPRVNSDDCKKLLADLLAMKAIKLA